MSFHHEDSHTVTMVCIPCQSSYEVPLGRSETAQCPSCGRHMNIWRKSKK